MAKVILHYRYYNEVVDSTGDYQFLQQWVEHRGMPKTFDSVSMALFRELLYPISILSLPGIAQKELRGSPG